MPTRRLVFLDRDGTLNVERGFVTKPSELELVPGGGAAVRRLKELGFGVVVVTNQSAIGRGLLTPEGLVPIHERLHALLAAEGAALDSIQVCPHAPDDGCACRKPLPTLLERAAAELGGDLTRSFMVGDKAADMGAGRAAGATAILVTSGYGAATLAAGETGAHHVVPDLPAAVALIETLG